MSLHRPTVAVVMTVKNDARNCPITLASLARQCLRPDEIIVVDGGSTDGTIDAVHNVMAGLPGLRVIEAPGVNIARGRNIGVAASSSDIVATIDSGCRAETRWLEKLIAPFEREPQTAMVAGFYRIDPHSLLETVVGLATMRGQLDPVCPISFNPSARSMACKRLLWERAGGWPEWIGYSEDTLFDQKVRRMNARWEFAGDAVVHWRPRSSIRAIARQFYHYGTGRGHTQIGARDFAYNLRNMGFVAAAAGFGLVTSWAIIPLVLLLLYFYGWTFHAKAARIARHTSRPVAYPLCLCVMWIVLVSNTFGYLVGSWQRWRGRARFRIQMEAYLAGT